ncbi:Crp/Fnr family transcriptional regulator [Zhengella mangrovi]|uniref:Crp/Fnr family transcriptional regulator n=1 Tax=Zhengella mangrovi TaxID=1982044 RepID=A0A2G1QPA3_9HYPH|nr:Crp/Fnr family transcriptional regulator [Zhengella mangrovi]PHP67366.1 Crp/Fnr family transcriptional regulator [Zhengella mangrovi]
MDVATDGLDAATKASLERLAVSRADAGTVLFRPGDDAAGFVLVHEGRIGVYLTGRSGRDILLYSVERGQTCIQTTLGLLGGEAYTGEGIAETPIAFSVLPRGDFMALMENSAPFRAFVFRSFAGRLNDVTRLLEQVAFVRVEQRLARVLIERAGEDGTVHLTHQALASAIGSAREVVSRRLEALRSRGLVELDRGLIRVADRPGLRHLAEGE